MLRVQNATFKVPVAISWHQSPYELLLEQEKIQQIKTTLGLAEEIRTQSSKKWQIKTIV